jgi:4-nitrophenyl phosphatase
LTPDIAARIRDASGFIFDMDGTIALGDAASGGHKALPHAVALLNALRERGKPYCVFTNGTAKPPAAYAESLRNAGFDIRDAEMMTPSSSAARWFVKMGISRVRVLCKEGGSVPLRTAGITVIGPSEKAEGVEAVYTGWHRDFSFADMEAACESVWQGAILTTASHVPFFATATGRGIGSSFAINKMITSLTGKQAKVLGKPSRIALDAAVHAMGLRKSAARNIVVVGDDPALEMKMANSAKALSIGVTTGLMTHDTIANLPTAEQPALLLDSLEALLGLLHGQ